MAFRAFQRVPAPKRARPPTESSLESAFSGVYHEDGREGGEEEEGRRRMRRRSGRAPKGRTPHTKMWGKKKQAVLHRPRITGLSLPKHVVPAADFRVGV